MASCTKTLYGVELDIGAEAGRPYWVLHSECDSDGTHVCVYTTRREASEAAKGRDHESRVVRFCRDPVSAGVR